MSCPSLAVEFIADEMFVDTITHSIPEVVPQLLYILVPIPLPLSALLILVIDLGFELFVALVRPRVQPPRT